MPKRKSIIITGPDAPASGLAPMAPGGGNTKPPLKKRCNASRCWNLTWNNFPGSNGSNGSNYTDSEGVSGLRKALDPLGRYCFQVEKGESGTVHIQGWVEFKTKCRPIEATGLPKSIHWEVQRGSNAQCWAYVTKSDSKLAGPWSNFKMPRPVVKMTYDMLRPEQKTIADLFAEPEDPLFGRKIYWYWEQGGDWGKSILCKYLIDCCDALCLSGKGNDCLHGIADYVTKHDGVGPDIVVFDIPRENLKYVSYTAMEKIKDGRFFSGKYESGMVAINSPHIICFANELPKLDALSHDRWVISHIGVPAADNITN